MDKQMNRFPSLLTSPLTYPCALSQAKETLSYSVSSRSLEGRLLLAPDMLLVGLRRYSLGLTAVSSTSRQAGDASSIDHPNNIPDSVPPCWSLDKAVGGDEGF
ncbi:hypothetical protein DR999_PMT17960 [Platysternon megacephalum]|uniref:Uncharacterized protein n=1 Tax=Platysternon megacephalum TaxID=55544 RepID=A0A4D9DS76_9SAUR|nr:hypothetical protein DR999_PMT17960 [Platysternon megacephalum]